MLGPWMFFFAVSSITLCWVAPGLKAMTKPERRNTDAGSFRWSFRGADMLPLWQARMGARPFGATANVRLVSVGSRRIIMSSRGTGSPMTRSFTWDSILPNWEIQVPFKVEPTRGPFQRTIAQDPSARFMATWRVGNLGLARHAKDCSKSVAQSKHPLKGPELVLRREMPWMFWQLDVCLMLFLVVCLRLANKCAVGCVYACRLFVRKTSCCLALARCDAFCSS